jgi:DNA repair protein RadC
MAGFKRNRSGDGAKSRRAMDSGYRNETLKMRLLREGAASFSDSEVLELLLSFAVQPKEVQPLAEHLTARFGDLRGVLISSTLDLASVPGVSEHAAALIRLAGELVARGSEAVEPSSEILARPDELQHYLLARMRGMKEEKILLIFFDHQGAVLAEEFVGAGTIDQAVIFPRQIMELALRCNAGALIIAHNHLHGPPLPTVQDSEEAERLREILRPFDITLEDSIVVGQTKCFSIFKNAPIENTRVLRE